MSIWYHYNKLVIVNRKGVKGRIDNMCMPLLQLCQKASVNILQIRPLQITGERDWTIDTALVRSGWHRKMLTCQSQMGASQWQVSGQNRPAHCKGVKNQRYLTHEQRRTLSLSASHAWLLWHTPLYFRWCAGKTFFGEYVPYWEPRLIM